MKSGDRIRYLSTLYDNKTHYLSALYEEGFLTADEFVREFIQEILKGRLTRISELSFQLPGELAEFFHRWFCKLEEDNYVDTWPWNRFESIEEREARAERLRDQYKVVFAEIRAYFAELGE